ncbi:MAG: ABC transporter permease [Xanthobacteraceae bacterium]|nr:MAG: ABC transporter permease [Xanthobacteraceae bacterium]
MPLIEGGGRRLSPIVPRGSIAGHALVAVVAIMTFLAALATGIVLLVRGAATEWQSEVASEVTIQVRPVPGRDLDRDVRRAVEIARAAAGVSEVRPFSGAESVKLLEPWLGSGLKTEDLPVPRMIVVRIAPGATADFAALRAQLAQEVPPASFDDHRAWIERMRAMTSATAFAGLGIVVLVILVTVISVSFATRGAMAASRPIVEVLHFVGAGDRYIANRFLGHFLRLGLEGAAIGGGAAILLFGLGESVSAWFSGTVVGDQFAALLGTFSLRPSGYLILAAQALLIALITVWASRRTLYATIADIE